MGRMPECASDGGAIESGSTRLWHEGRIGSHVSPHPLEFNGPVTTGSRLNVCMGTGPGWANVVVEETPCSWYRPHPKGLESAASAVPTRSTQRLEPRHSGCVMHRIGLPTIRRYDLGAPPA